MKPLPCLLLVLTTCAMGPVGCGGPENGRQIISGTVTYVGQPLVYGTITFDPDASQGGSGPQGSAEIHQGWYQTAPDLSPVEGPHIVRVTGWKNSPTEGMLGEPLVSEYTTNIVVPKGGEKFDLDIPAQAPARRK